MKRIKTELIREFGHEPSEQELANRMSISTDKLRVLQRAIKNPISFETPIGTEGSSTIGETIQDENSQTPQEIAAQNEVTHQTRELLGTLKTREECVIRMRCGNGSTDSMTLAEAALRFEITREGVRKIEIKALNKLRHPSRVRRLQPTVRMSAC